MDVIEYSSLYDFLTTSYETLLAALRLPLPVDTRERIQGELSSRDRAAQNQWAEICGDEFH